MKICLINNLIEPYGKGGAEKYTQAVAAGLAEGNEVVIITTRPFCGFASLRPSVEERNGIKTYSFFPLNVYHHNTISGKRPQWLKPLWHLLDIWNLHPYLAIRSILKKEKPDVVHSFNLAGLSASVFAAVRAAGCPHIHSLLDCSLVSPWAMMIRNGKVIKFNFFDRLYMRVRRWLATPADIVLSQSNNVLDVHIKNGYFKDAECMILRNAIRMKKHQHKEKDYSNIDILFVGMLAKHKGVYVLLDAFEKLGREDARLHFAGTGAELEKLKERAAGMKNVFVHGFIDGDELANLYESANITVVPSTCIDNFPGVMVESFSFGTPVAGSRIGGIPEAVTDGVNGRLFEAGDSEDLRRVLSGMIDDREALKKMQAEALKSAREYGLEKHIDNLLGIYRKLMDKKKSLRGEGGG